jgi:hypothetical protein
MRRETIAPLTINWNRAGRGRAVDHPGKVNQGYQPCLKLLHKSQIRIKTSINRAKSG